MDDDHFVSGCQCCIPTLFNEQVGDYPTVGSLPLRIRAKQQKIKNIIVDTAPIVD